MNQMKTARVISISAVLILAGCVGLKSTKLGTPTSDPTPARRVGIAYSLPRAKIHIHATRVDPANGQSTIKTIKKPHPPAGSNATNATSLKPKKEAAKQDSPENRTPQAQAAYYQITMDAIYEPDPANTFLLNPTRRCTSDDTFQIVVTNGLLSTISSTNTDQTGEVLVQLAKTGIEAFKLAAGFPGVRMTVGPEQPKYPKELDVVFYPDNADSVKDASNYLKHSDGANELFHLQIMPPDTDLKKWTTLTAKDGEQFDGFFYRSVVPYTITLSNTQEMSSISKTFLLPNGAPILSWSPKRAALVRSVNHVTLENGTLTGVYVDKPSTALATVKIPLSILQAILAVPTELIQLKFNYSSMNKSLLDSQKSEIASLQALLEAQRALLQYRATNSVPGQ